MRNNRFRHAVKLTALTLLILSGLSCGGDSGPAGPPSGETVPVEWAAQLEGRWRTDEAFVLGLPVTELLVPGIVPGRFDFRLTGFGNDLVVSVTSDRTGLFSLISSGTAADTADPLKTISGAHQVTGSFSVTEGVLEVTLLLENSTPVEPRQVYTGGARFLGDTLLLDFTLQVPPHKAVPFLPAETGFLARLVKNGTGL